MKFWFSSGSGSAAASSGGKDGHLERIAAQDGSGSSDIADGSLENAARKSDAAGTGPGGGGSDDGIPDSIQGPQSAPDDGETVGANPEDAKSRASKVQRADEVSGDWTLAAAEKVQDSAGGSTASPGSAGGDSSPHRSRDRRGHSGRIDTGRAGSQDSGSGGNSSSSRIRGTSTNAGGSSRSSTTSSSNSSSSGDSGAIKGTLGTDGHVLCQKYTPAGCHLVRGQVKPLQWPQCNDPPGHYDKAGHNCEFELISEFPHCPLPSTGLYFRQSVPQQQCMDPPFWQEASEALPSCDSGKVCCSADRIVGYWSVSKESGHTKDFREAESMGCHYHAYTRQQVLKCFADTNLVFWGDSMVRQLFGRLPSLFRGQLRSVDSNRWRATRYDVCESADAEVTAPSWDFVSPKDSEYLKADLLNVIEANATMLKFDETVETELLDLADPEATPRLFPGATCGSTRPVGFKYVPTTDFPQAVRMMPPFANTHPDLTKAVFLVQVGFWDITSTQPTNEYLDTLSDVLASGLQWMIVLTVPTKIVGIDEHDNRRGVFRSRNDVMRKWAYNHRSGRVSILDFDSLSWTDNAPSGLIGNWTDWHYGCKFDWVQPEGNKSAAERSKSHNGWLDKGSWPIGDIHPNRARDCVDDMNRQLLQIVFNLVCNSRGTGAQHAGKNKRQTLRRFWH